MTEEERARRHVDFWLRNKWAILWTVGNSGEDAKRPRGHGWQETPPLSGEPGALAGQFAENIQRRNPMVVTGTSGLVGIDCDDEPGLAAFLALHFPETLWVQTSAPYKRHVYYGAPSVCPHHYFEFAGGVVKAKQTQALVLPPGRHPSGVEYAYRNGVGIEPLSLELYQRLLQLAGAREQEQRERLQNDPEAKVTPGNRRDTIFRYACMHRRWTSSPEVILAACLAFNAAHCEPPLTGEQVVYQVEGALKLPGGGEELAGTGEPDIGEIVSTPFDAFADVDRRAGPRAMSFATDSVDARTRLSMAAASRR